MEGRKNEKKAKKSLAKFRVFRLVEHLSKLNDKRKECSINYRITSIKRPLRITPPPPSKGAFIWNILLFPGRKHVYTLFELLDEDIVEAIDEENDDDELEIL